MSLQFWLNTTHKLTHHCVLVVVDVYGSTFERKSKASEIAVKLIIKQNSLWSSSNIYLHPPVCLSRVALFAFHVSEAIIGERMLAVTSTTIAADKQRENCEWNLFAERNSRKAPRNWAVIKVNCAKPKSFLESIKTRAERQLQLLRYGSE